MPKLKNLFGKRVLGKGLPHTGMDSPAEALSDKYIGGSPTRAPAPHRWGKQHGRSMIEMLGVLAIIGVLSITALVGFTYAMNKHRANETIYDVMLRGTNVPMVDEYYANKPSGHEFRFPGLPGNGKRGTYYPMTTKKDTGSSYYVEATGVTYRVCEMILKMNPTDIDQIVVGNTVYQGDSDICGTNDGLAMKFCFGTNGTICNGTGHGGSSGGSGGTSGGESSDGSGSGSSGSGSGSDLCAGIIPTSDCSLTADIHDENGCVTVKKITCAEDTYCSVDTCELCPAAETCDGESCCALTGPEDVCGRPTKEVGTITTVTHSDLNANGCCTDTSEESCSLNPVIARTCTPTCDGVCQSDGTCRPDCESGFTYNETAGQCCEELTTTACQTVTSATSGTCPTLTNVADGTECTTDSQTGTCQNGTCQVAQTCSSWQDCSDGECCESGVCVSHATYCNIKCTEMGTEDSGYGNSCTSAWMVEDPLQTELQGRPIYYCLYYDKNGNEASGTYCNW